MKCLVVEIKGKKPSLLSIRMRNFLIDKKEYSSYWTIFVYSAGIESVVERENKKDVLGVDPLFCTACQMTVVWVQNQLRQDQTKDAVLQYVNKVICSKILFAHVFMRLVIHYATILQGLTLKQNIVLCSFAIVYQVRTKNQLLTVTASPTCQMWLSLLLIKNSH